MNHARHVVPALAGRVPRSRLKAGLQTNAGSWEVGIAASAAIRKNPGMDESARLYLDLLKKCLTFALWEETLLMPFDTAKASAPGDLVEFDMGLRKLGYCLAREFPYRREIAWEGEGITYLGYTMIGMKRLANFQECIERAIEENTPGDILETGVWRGGACILARAVPKVRRVCERKVWLADSFQGLPPPNAEKYPLDQGDDLYLNPFLRVPVEVVQENFRRFGLLDDQVCFLKGWFKDTLPTAPVDRLCVLRLDGDLYESTLDALTALYDKVSINGFVIIDDYDGKGCRQAVTDFRHTRGIRDEIIPIDQHGAFWRRTR